jgi:hypothetical protein
MYGKGSSINKICVLSKEQYIETKLCSIEPNFFRKLDGTHHLHSNGDTSVFDYAEKHVQITSFISGDCQNLGSTVRNKSG